MAWIAAINRPVSGFGALLAWNGLVRWRTCARLAPALLLAGFAWQYLANEEVYGTAGLAVVWLAFLAVRGVRPRTTLLVGGAVVAMVLIHFFFLQRVPGGADNVLAAGVAGAPASALRRASDVIGGVGPACLLPLLLFAVLLWLNRPDVAGFMILAWLFSFVPFALDDAVEYRHYPTLAPTALLIGGLGRASERNERTICLVLGLLVVAGSWGPRRARLDAWREATLEVRAIEALVLDPQWSPAGAVPALVNLDTSTAAIFVYHLEIEDVSELATVDFLDGEGAYVPPTAAPGPPWVGRRVDGSYGVIDPATYFGHRTALEELRLVGDIVQAPDLAMARARLADPTVDLVSSAVGETDVAALGERTAAGSVVVLEPFTGDPVSITGRMLIGVRADGPTVLCVQSTWQYSHMMRIAADQTLFSDVSRVRVLRMEAAIEGESDVRTAFPMNAFGFGVPLPAGDHRIELRWRRATPEELRE